MAPAGSSGPLIIARLLGLRRRGHGNFSNALIRGRYRSRIDLQCHALAGIDAVEQERGCFARCRVLQQQNVRPIGGAWAEPSQLIGVAEGRPDGQPDTPLRDGRIHRMKCAVGRLSTQQQPMGLLAARLAAPSKRCSCKK